MRHVGNGRIPAFPKKTARHLFVPPAKPPNYELNVDNAPYRDAPCLRRRQKPLPLGKKQQPKVLKVVVKRALRFRPRQHL